MESDGARLAGRQLLLAEELALLAISERNGAFPGTPALETALAGGLLIELRERQAIAVAGGRLTHVERWPSGDALLDEIAREIEIGPVSRALGSIVRRGPAERLVERLERRGILARHREVVLGVIPITRHSVVPPRLRLHWTVRIHAIVRREADADAREHAMVPLLAASGILRGFVLPSERGQAASVAADLASDDPIQDAVARAIALIGAGDAPAMVAVSA